MGKIDLISCETYETALAAFLVSLNKEISVLIEKILIGDLNYFDLEEKEIDKWLHENAERYREVFVMARYFGTKAILFRKFEKIS